MSGLKNRRVLWRERANREHTLYRLFDADENLLYVGVSCMPGHRLNTHRKERRWWDQVARLDFVVFPDRQQALEAERRAITTEHPRHNLVWRVT